MKKTSALLTFSAAVLLSGSALAQNDNGTAVGNPDSDNVLVIEQQYEAVVVPAANNQAPAAAPKTDKAPTVSAPAAAPAAAPSAVEVDETLTQTPDGVEYEMDAVESD